MAPAADLRHSPLRISPQAGPQEHFLSAGTDIAFYGGAAGGGKTWAILVDALRGVDLDSYNAVIFRRTFPEITNVGGMWDKSTEIYSQVSGATFKVGDLEWTFASGAKIRFSHLQHETSKFGYQGAQIVGLYFDELTHFSRSQFFYMISRNRLGRGGSDPRKPLIEPYVRATMNPVPPEDEVGGWIHEFVGWYIDEHSGLAIPERGGVIRWFVHENNTLFWASSPEELTAQFPEAIPKSFTFIPANLADNQRLLDIDPGYLGRLKALDAVEQQRLLHGNWLARESAGNLFNRAWFNIVDAVPAGGTTVRFWDLAATEKKFSKDSPDATATVKMRRVGDMFFILDAQEFRLEPAATNRMLLNVAAQDGREVHIRWEMEGGASGKRDNQQLASLLRGYDARGVRPQGDKILRAKAVASQALAGNVSLLRGSWNNELLNHLHRQPHSKHDDLMDATSGAFNFFIATRLKSGRSYRG